MDVYVYTEDGHTYLNSMCRLRGNKKSVMLTLAFFYLLINLKYHRSSSLLVDRAFYGKDGGKKVAVYWSVWVGGCGYDWILRIYCISAADVCICDDFFCVDMTGVHLNYFRMDIDPLFVLLSGGNWTHVHQKITNYRSVV